MKVVILAAGKGERLYPLTRNTPKSLIHLGHGVTILESQLECIAAAGISEVAIVCGYRAEQIEAKVGLYRRDHGLQIEIVYNPFYEISNNLVSLWFARYEMLASAGVIVLNGDDVCQKTVLAGLMAVPQTHELCVTISRKAAYDWEDMKVRIDAGRLLRISKDIPPEASDAESVGIVRFTGKAVFRLVGTLDAMVRVEANRTVFWLEAINDLIRQGWPVWPYEIDDGDWAEIDFHLDVQTITDRFRDAVPWLPGKG